MRLEESNTSSQPLVNPDTNSEENQILQSIVKLRAELDRIVSTTGPSKRSLSIRGEIKRLLDQIANCKTQARECSAQISQEKG